MDNQPIVLSECNHYVEDWAVCYGDGEPKGQCSKCGAKWYEHRLEALPDDEKESAKQIQAERGIAKV